MSLHNRQREQMLEFCAEIREDDGYDAHRYVKSHSGRNKQDRKTLQLCRQVEQTLSLVLSGDFSDELLQSLIVVSVMPAPSASQLLVTVGIPIDQEDTPDPSAVLQRLDSVAGRLRSEVAASISRKRTPRLSFSVVPF